MSVDFEAIKQAAEGRCLEIIISLTPIRSEHLVKGPTDWPCPQCGGESTFYVDSRDGGVNQHGKCVCRKCTAGRPTGDIVDTVVRWGGYSGQQQAALAIADYLGLAHDTVSCQCDLPSEAQVTCDQCNAEMVPSSMVVDGWRNWDCDCGHVSPLRIGDATNNPSLARATTEVFGCQAVRAVL